MTSCKAAETGQTVHTGRHMGLIPLLKFFLFFWKIMELISHKYHKCKPEVQLCQNVCWQHNHNAFYIRWRVTKCIQQSILIIIKIIYHINGRNIIYRFCCQVLCFFVCFFTKQFSIYCINYQLIRLAKKSGPYIKKNLK